MYDPVDPVLQSRYPHQKFLLKGGHEEKEAQLMKILDELPYVNAVLMTNSDRLVEFISRHENKLLVKYRYVIPTRKLLQALNDKKQETKLISSLGFDIPKTVQELPPDYRDLESELRYPIIFKPYLFEAARYFPEKNAVVTDRESLEQFYRDWSDAIPYLLAQEVIPGPDSYSWITSCTFDKQHNLLDCGVKQKIRAFPAHFGGSTFAVSRSNDEMVELTRELGRKLKLSGHAGIEFRWDERDQRYKYLEINPRIPANVGFDEACGLPTVMNSYRVSLGESVVPSGNVQRNGVYFIDLNHDPRSLQADGVPAYQIIGTYAKLLIRPTNGMYFAWDDPMPGLEILQRKCVTALRRLGRLIGINPQISVQPMQKKY